MSHETDTEIPDEIRGMMTDEEIANMRNLDGWAVGTVELVDDEGRVAVTIEDAWIELFNGEGRAGHFGGVRFMAIDSASEYQEAYAYPSRDALDGNEPGWFVAEWDAPSEPDVGPVYPDGPGVQK